ncbi:MAG: tetratricopeptide repeat protein [Chlamydiales bacterium]
MNLFSIEELENLYSRGYYLYKTENYPKAIEIFQELITIDPTYPPYLQAWAASLQASGDYHRAIYSWSSLIHITPTCLFAYLHLAECLISLEAIQQALGVLKSAKQLFSEPSNANDLYLQNQITLLETRWSSVWK